MIDTIQHNNFKKLKPIKIASLTDHTYTPSSRFRIRQYTQILGSYNIKVTDFPRFISSEYSSKVFKKSKISNNPLKLLYATLLESGNVLNTSSRIYKANFFDAVWISRELLIGYPSFEFFLQKPYFYDIDDAIFLRGKFARFGIDKMIKNASAIFCGNSYLANYCDKFSKNIFIIPTSVDTDKFSPNNIKLPNINFTFGWSGTSTSFKYFHQIEDELFKFFSNHKDVQLKIISDRYPYELKKLYKFIKFELWSSQNEVDQIRSFDVGLMPLENSEWIKGKCSYKMLLYASCGIPTIASYFGMNKEIIDYGDIGLGCILPNDWTDALEYFYINRFSSNSRFLNCRKIIIDNFSIENTTIKINKVIRSTL